MGQYYVPVVLDDDDNITHAMCCYDYNNGAKLMEHSWLDNDFVAAFETLLVQESPVRVVWAGDYADAEVDDEGNPRTIKSDRYTAGEGEANLYTLSDDVEHYRPDVPGLGEKHQYNWTYKSGPRKGERRKTPLVTATVDEAIKATATCKPTVVPTIDSHPYLLNWDRREYVDKRKVPAVKYYWGKEKLAIHPLPLLTVEGNGRGGGDFSTEGYGDRSQPKGNFNLIGSWARDHISLSEFEPVGLSPAGLSAPREWTEINFDLAEMGVDETELEKEQNNKMRSFV